MEKSNDRGIVYIATGADFVEETRISAESAKSVMPDIPITLFTDLEIDMPVFDRVVQIENPRHDFGDQVYHLDKTPYERTVFFDSDIYVDESVEDLFDILDEFDIAAAHNQKNWSSKRVDYKAIDALPDCFPEYNSGVVAFKLTPTVSDFFETWRDTYAEVLDRGQIHNQAAFRLALYRSDVRIATLPSEYNCVFRRSGCVNGQIKIFHGRLHEMDTPGAGMSVDIDQAVDELNSRTNLRSYYRLGDEVRLSNPSLVRRSLHSVQTRGVVETTKRIAGFLKRKMV